VAASLVGWLACVDLDSLDEIPGARLTFPNPDDVMHFELDITPPSGMYQGATFKFDVEVEREYPIRPPKVLCRTKARDTLAAVLATIPMALG